MVKLLLSVALVSATFFVKRKIWSYLIFERQLYRGPMSFGIWKLIFTDDARSRQYLNNDVNEQWVLAKSYLYSGYALLGFYKVVKNVSLFWACDKNIAG